MFTCPRQPQHSENSFHQLFLEYIEFSWDLREKNDKTWNEIKELQTY